MKEEWRPVLDDHYEVSNKGRVRRLLAASSTNPGEIRATPLDRYGYPRLNASIRGKVRNVTVHSLVASAFIGPRPDGYHVNHIDGVKTNNSVTNLEYMTPSENSAHAARMGLMASGDRHGMRKDPSRAQRGEDRYNAKLDADKVRAIRAAGEAGESQRSVARRFGVSQVMIGAVMRRDNWKHIE